ncbi:acyltransferase [Corynebacterium bovis]|uniref:acyltransferase n=1 Tax=Corynebacterium bovis TaxID=36808 RepID=UPI00313A3FD4
MRIIESSDWQPEGRVVAWAAAPAMTAAVEAAPDDPTPPSFLQRDHILSCAAARAAGGTHRAYTASIATVNAPLDTARMTAVVDAFIASHEGLRSVFSTDGESVRRRTLGPDDVAMAPTVIFDPAGDAAGDAGGDAGGDATGTAGDAAPATAAEAIDALLPRHAVFDHVPGCALVAVDRGDSFELLYALDHAFGDGISQVTGILELLARYAGADVPPLTDDEHPGFLGYVREEYARAAAVTDDSPGVRLWGELFDRVGGTPQFPLDTGIVDGEPQWVGGLFCDPAPADLDQVAALRRLAAQRGVSFSTVVYALMALAERRTAGTSEYATVVVSATRGERYPVSQGWFCNFSPLFFEMTGDTVEDILDAVSAAQHRMKEALPDPVHACVGRLIEQGRVDASVMASPQLITYIDLSWFREPGDHDIRLFTGLGKTRNASFWLFRDEDGLTLGCQAPDNPTAVASLERYFTALREIVAETAARYPA